MVNSMIILSFLSKICNSRIMFSLQFKCNSPSNKTSPYNFLHLRDITSNQFKGRPPRNKVQKDFKIEPGKKIEGPQDSLISFFNPLNHTNT